MHNLRPIDFIALLLVIVGGLNWGMVGLFDIDLVAITAGELGTIFSRIIYMLVGVAALWTAGRSPYMAHLREFCKGHKPHPV